MLVNGLVRNVAADLCGPSLAFAWRCPPPRLTSHSVHTDLLRVLISDEESALLFSLSNYLTFRGYQVDCTERLADAQALVHHLHYDVVVVGLRADELTRVRELAVELRGLKRPTRVVALAPESFATESAGMREVRRGSLPVDRVIARDQPLDDLAREVCSALDD